MKFNMGLATFHLFAASFEVLPLDILSSVKDELREVEFLERALLRAPLFDKILAHHTRPQLFELDELLRN